MTTKMKDDEQRRLLENVAAISAEFHKHPDFDALYAHKANSVGGASGFYHECVLIAKGLTQWENANGGMLAYENTGGDWYEAIDDRVSRYYRDWLQQGESTQNASQNAT